MFKFGKLRLRRVALYLMLATSLYVFMKQYRYIYTYRRYTLAEAMGINFHGQNLFSDTPSNNVELGQCAGKPEKKNVYFLKVHKTGSTTFKNILQRYLFKNNLSLPFINGTDVFPSKNLTKYLVPMKYFYRRYLELKQTGVDVTNLSPSLIHEISDAEAETRVIDNQCNLIDMHTVFVRDQAMKILPPDVVFVSTLRHPLSFMKSAFIQWDLPTVFGIQNHSDPVEVFLSDPQKYDKIVTAPLYKPKAVFDGVNLSYTKNYMSYGYGFDSLQTDNETYVSDYLGEINETFKVVILTERYIESLILIKRELCWTFEDIIHVAQRNKSYESKTKEYSETLLDNHKNWASLDYKIYNMFLDRHEKILENGGSLLREEINTFVTVLNNVTNFCHHVIDLIAQNKEKHYPSLQEIAKINHTINPTRFNGAFNISGADCVIMSLDEFKLFMAIRVHQQPQLCDQQFNSFVQQLQLVKGITSRYCVEDKDIVKYHIPYSMMHSLVDSNRLAKYGSF